MKISFNDENGVQKTTEAVLKEVVKKLGKLEKENRILISEIRSIYGLLPGMYEPSDELWNLILFEEKS